MKRIPNDGHGHEAIPLATISELPETVTHTQPQRPIFDVVSNNNVCVWNQFHFLPRLTSASGSFVMIL